MENNIETGLYKKNLRKNLIIWLLVLIIIALVINTVRLVVSKGDLDKELNKTASEKINVSNDLQKMMNDYEMLKTSNDTINAKLSLQQERIKVLLVELKNVKYSNVAELARYKSEVEALRKIMKSYIVQVDSLNTMNQTLVAENTQVRNDFRKVKDDYQVLTTEKNDLNIKVTKASALSCANIVAGGISDKGKESTKAKKTEKIQVCFTIKENAIAKLGNKDVFIRIARPDGFVLAVSKNDLFDFEGKQIVFSAKKNVNYAGKDENMCIYFKPDEVLTNGIFHVDIFIEGNLIGKSDFELK